MLLTSSARITPGFDLPARWVIHTVGPVWHGGTQGEPELLASCYRNCLDLARKHAVKSIAFPSISTGVYGYPKQLAASVALQIMRDYDGELDEIIACCFSDEDASRYKELLVQYEG